ncbi:hypothetical protein BK128_02900 [Viridibacillus sp. FSL H7-0596]|uniref:DUF3397 family protein n=1 Tax=Viridibacillus sp. FSL H7-0596 TaxID=1928923 RepID=UPI00096D6671|nr:DUF3397 family protein [Viridibacillus sp. FSL H7-0596]OMC88903.1 hypothetical protein BK128_02900 [Viridibacillus sp. FSL H7-0596]
MMYILSIFLHFIVLCPVILFLIIYSLLKKLPKKREKVFGRAADITTFLLFFSVPESVHFLWGDDIGFITFIFAIIIAIVFTIIEWRSTKEIEILPLFRKIWRFLFLALTITYVVIWIIIIVQRIILYVTMT